MQTATKTNVLPDWYTKSDKEFAINRYVDAVTQRVALTYKDSANANPEVSVIEGPKYWKITVTTWGQTSVHSFVKRETGEVFKPAGWSAPAKHARGNINNEDDGSGALDAYGIKYLR